LPFWTRENSVILSAASEYQRAAFGALNQFRRKPKDLRFHFAGTTTDLNKEKLCHPERSRRLRCAAFGATNNSEASRRTCFSCAGSSI
jgi:hypothetical protein